MANCTRPGCDRPYLARGMCSTHYDRWRKGRPLDAPICVRGGDPTARVRRKTVVTEPPPCRGLTTPCWLWTGFTNGDGYGALSFGGRMWLAHRLTYEATRGAVPDGFELDHLCRRRACVNPDHLEPVTHVENVRRGTRAPRATECRKGHPYTSATAYTYGQTGARQCRVCRGERRRAAYAADPEPARERMRQARARRARASSTA